MYTGHDKASHILDKMQQENIYKYTQIKDIPVIIIRCMKLIVDIIGHWYIHLFIIVAMLN